MMLYTHVATGILAAAVASAATWQIQNWRYSDIIAKIEQKHIKEKEQALAAAQENFKRVNNASANAEKRAAVARRDADNAKSELDRLRQSLIPIPASSPACTSCADRANALSELLGQCSAALEGLARKADKHVNDIQTLKEAWPK